MRLDRRVAVTLAALSLPVVIAVLAVSRPTWYPTYDWAWLEMRTRDVPHHLPLVGPTGRFFAYGTVGHHLGAIDYYLLAPVYRLLGGSTAALVASSAAVNVAGLGCALWLAGRRGGRRLAVIVAVVLAVLVHAIDPERMVVPWNPWLPILWWVVFLLAAWSVVCDDLPMLPLVAGAGSICALSHMSFVLSVAGVVAAMLVHVAVTHRQQWRVAVPWLGAFVAVGGLLWIPIVVEELTNDPGNVSIVLEHFRLASSQTLGIVGAFDTWLAHLDPVSFAVGRHRTDGAPLPGLVFGATIAIALVVAWRRRSTVVAKLLAVVALALVLHLVSISRIDGPVHSYLVLWMWGTTAVALVGVLLVALPHLGAIAPHTRGAIASVVLVVATAASSSRAIGASPPFNGQSTAIRGVLPALRELDRDLVYVVHGDDPHSGVGLAYGLVDALDHEGFDANLVPAFSFLVGGHRTVEASDADAQLVYVTGERIARWRDRDDVDELAFVDAPAADGRRLATLRGDVLRVLAEADAMPLAGLLEVSLFELAVGPATPPAAVPYLEEMLDLQVPTALFIIHRGGLP